ncbi:MAG: hypothetical protein OEZ39_07440 [Gammaproteobacteria bacterium]|nr:hypothetical protein [Gammaproteobacteria bacterium]MDH5651691.1 hypothetical protein [Gammaproteobacteria bacterium]
MAAKKITIGDAYKKAAENNALFNKILLKTQPIIDSVGARFKPFGTALAAIEKRYSKVNDAVKDFKKHTLSINSGIKKVFGGFGKLKSKLETIKKHIAAGKGDKSGLGGVVSADEFDKYSAGVNVFSANMKNLNDRVDVLGMTFVAALIPALNQLLPTINELLPTVISVVDSLIKWVVANPELVQGITGLVGGLWLFTGPFAAILGGVKAITTGVALLGATVIANPILLLIGAVAVAAGLIIANWDKVKQFLLKIWEPVKPYVMSVVNFIGNIVKQYFYFIVGLWTMVGSAIMSVIEPVAKWLAEIWQGVAAVMSEIWTTVEPYWTAFTDGVRGAFSIVADAVLSAWQGVKDFFMSIWDDVKPLWDAFTNAIGNMWDKLTKPFKFVVGIGKSTVEKFSGTLKNWFGRDDSAQGANGTTTAAGELQKMVSPAKNASVNNTTSNVMTSNITIASPRDGDANTLARLVEQAVTRVMNNGQIAARNTRGGFVN